MAASDEYVDALVCSELKGPYELKRVKLGEMRADELIVRMVATDSSGIPPGRSLTTRQRKELHLQEAQG